MSSEFTHIRALSLSDAIMRLAGGGARLLAGGTDLPASLQIDGARTTKVVDISGLEDLRGFTPTADGGLRIGALCSLAEVARHPTIGQRYVALKLAASSAGAADLLGRATIGGNLCQRPRCWYLRSQAGCVRQGGDLCFAADGENHYHGILGTDVCHMVHPSDVAPALVALDARARVVGPSGLRVVPFGDFFLPPGRELARENVLGAADVLTDVLLPPAPPGCRSTYRRVSEAGTDHALASVAASALLVQGRPVRIAVVLGAAAPVPWRAVEAEAVVLASRPDRTTVERAADAALAEAIPLADNRYKIPLFRSLLVDALNDVCGLTQPG